MLVITPCLTPLVRTVEKLLAAVGIHVVFEGLATLYSWARLT